MSKKKKFSAVLFDCPEKTRLLRLRRRDTRLNRDPSPLPLSTRISGLSAYHPATSRTIIRNRFYAKALPGEDDVPYHYSHSIFPLRQRRPQTPSLLSHPSLLTSYPNRRTCHAIRISITFCAAISQIITVLQARGKNAMRKAASR